MRDQGLHSAQRCGKRADPFSHLIAEELDRLGGANICGLAIEQIAHIGTDLRDPEKTRSRIDHLAELFRFHSFRARQISNQSRIEIAGACAHWHTGCGGESHAGIDRFSVADRHEAGAVTEVGEDHPAAGSVDPGESLEFFHEKGIGQAVKAVTPHSRRVVMPRNRKEARHSRQIAVKRGVEAGHLWQVGEALAHGLG